METIFTIENKLIEVLATKEATELFRRLLFAEGRRLGISPSNINISLWLNVPDGGIDASVNNVKLNQVAESGLIKAGKSSYQIKTGSSFKPWQLSQVEEELFGKGKDKNKKNLGESIRNCLDENGTYILVCFGLEFSDKDKRKTINNLKVCFKVCNYINPKVDVWGISNIISFCQIFPSLILEIKGFDRNIFQSFKSWSLQDDMKKDFKSGIEQTELIKNLRKKLQEKNDNEAIHIRLGGEPGIGKTRLVLEALSEDDLSPAVIYCDSPNKFQYSNLMNEIIKTDNHFSVLLVIDECDSNYSSYIWNKLKHMGSRIKIISIYNEYDETSGRIIYFNTPLLKDEKISEILQEYSIPKDQSDRWSELCSGSPRVAHVIGWNLKNNPEDILKPLDTMSDIWDRYIVGGGDRTSSDAERKRLILRYISLFKKFGFGPVFAGEAKAIHQKIEKSDPLITWECFLKVIKDLKKRKILQGENTLYITPKALHIYLWREWWETHLEEFDYKEFSKELPKSLVEWFDNMFKYAAESRAASKIVKKLLGTDGPFQKENYFNTISGSNFFLALTEANPKAALKCLQETIGTWKKEELKKFGEGRRNIVWALERIVVFKDLFKGAALLLLNLGEAENENYANNATGIFTDLFSPGPDRVAHTGASLEQRFTILKDYISSDSKQKRLLISDACDRALQTKRFSRIVGPEYQGLKVIKLWKPKSREEIVNYYKNVWGLVYSNVDNMQKDEQEKAIKILLSNAGSLSHIPEMVRIIISSIKNLINKSYSDKKEMLKAIESILYYGKDELPIKVLQKWKQLRKELIGSDFSSLMNRYVGMDLTEDKISKDGKDVDRVGQYINKLVEKVIMNPSLLKPELSWLVTQEAKNGYRFGYRLGQKDKGFLLLPMILDAQKKVSNKDSASDYFLGGYLRAIYEINPEYWETLLDELIENKDLANWIPSLTWRSGISDKAALRILNLAEKGIIDSDHFRIFNFGGVIRNLSEKVFKKWIEFLLRSTNEHAASIALDLYDFFYIRDKDKKKLPKELTLKLLTHPSLFKKLKEGVRDQMDDYHWTEIGIKYVQLYPDKNLKLADIILKNFGKVGSVLDGLNTQTHKVINYISRNYPKEVWEKVSKYLGPPIDERAFHIKEWLRGEGFFEIEEEGQLINFSPDLVFQWVDKNVEKRAWYLATFVPNTLFIQKGEICWVRELLIRYGDRKDVQNNLEANFSTEGWWGPESQHYQKKKEKLLDFKKEETNENVLRWIDNYIDDLDKSIERAKIEEERRY